MQATSHEQYKEIFDANYHLERFKRNIERPGMFTGRTARSDKEVLKALTNIAIELGAYSIHPGERKIAEISGKDCRTVSKALKRLTKQGWITNKWDADPVTGYASVWRINWDAKFLEDVEFMDDSEILIDRMLWSGYCLGENAQTIYRLIFLNDKGWRKQQIILFTGLKYKATTTALNLLVESKLVEKNNRTYYIRIFESEIERKDIIEGIKELWDINKKMEEKIIKHEWDRVKIQNLTKFSSRYKEDRRNAFNMIRIQKMIRVIRENLP